MKIILLYIGEEIASTVYDHLNSFQEYGKYSYSYANILVDEINADYVDQYDCVVVHYTISIFNDDRCPPYLRVILRNTNAKKIIFIQDEYRLINHVVENLDYIKASLLYTCVPETEIEKVYPKEKLPNLVKINTLTGFVPQNLLSVPDVPYEDRKTDVVYRARKLSAWYGRLGREKWVIAEYFSKDATRYDLITNISYHEKDRIYGNEWISFLRSSKSAIGCESGASVFDFTGNIQKNVELYELENPDASFHEIEEKFFKGVDGKIKLNQISPRCFECAALKTLMILYEGDYSGILIPWRHYVQLKKDHSNMNEVVEFIKSPKRWKTITDCAFEEIAMNKSYSYEYFVRKFEADLEKIFDFHHRLDTPPVRTNSLKQKSLSSDRHSTPKVKNLLAFLFGRKNLEILLLIKRRIMLSIRTFQSLSKRNNKKYYRYCFRKSFCEEFDLVQNIKAYVFSIQKKCGHIPLEIKKDSNNGLIILISNTTSKSENFDFSAISTKKNSISIEIEDSWGVPQNIRKKSHLMRYPTLLTDNRGL